MPASLFSPSSVATISDVLRARSSAADVASLTSRSSVCTLAVYANREDVRVVDSRAASTIMLMSDAPRECGGFMLSLLPHTSPRGASYKQLAISRGCSTRVNPHRTTASNGARTEQGCAESLSLSSKTADLCFILVIISCTRRLVLPLSK